MSDGWVLVYEGLDPKAEGLREALCTLGNGNFATRGAAEESRADGTHYPGTYVGGGYNQLASEVAGHTVVNEDLVNLPNWLWLSCCFPSGEELDLSRQRVLGYRQELHLDEGILVRTFRVEDGDGRVTRFESRRLVHMEKPNLAAIEWRLMPENWSGELVLTSGLDGSVINANVARYRQLSNKHLEVLHRGPVAPEGIYLKARTNQSHLEIAEAARTRVFLGDEALHCERRIVEEPERVAEEVRVLVREQAELRVEKVVALHTSKDRGIQEAGVAARLAITSAPDFASLRESHVAAWGRLWRRCDIDVDATLDESLKLNDELVLRLHIFHLLATASPQTVKRDVGIPARGLHGEAYRGHVFWDELFILPFYLQRLPSVARASILYRYYRLDAARDIAREAGCRGACFPWQSGSDGREATQQLHLNPLSGCWGPDHSRLQRHVSAAVVYNVWRYYEATNDLPFLDEYGAEIVLEVARFWASLAQEDPRTGRFHLTGVMGPDEYHEKYPGADVGGVKDNAYTNLTAVWCLARAFDVLDVLSRERAEELCQMLHIDDEELARWDAISHRMAVAFHDGVISQFEGYDQLEELDWAAYSARYGHIERLDRILKAEGDTPDRYKVSKQPDFVMLLYLFRTEELLSLFHRLGYTEVDEDTLRRSVEYYQARTSHGSTLSHVVFTSAVHRADADAGARLFLSALRSDLYDVQGGTTPEGVHLGAMAGTVDIVTRHYAGLELRSYGPCLAPDMPSRIRRLTFRFQHHARWYDVELEPSRLFLRVDDAGGEVTVYVYDEPMVLAPGEPFELKLEPGVRGRRLHVDETRLAGSADGRAAAP